MSIPSGYSETEDCGLCFSRLVIPASSDEASTSTLPDDVELPCHGATGGRNHHFHWACLQEKYDDSAARNTCPFPTCGRNVLNEEGKLLAIIRNEGGITEDFDILEAFDEDKAEVDMPEMQKKELYVWSSNRRLTANSIDHVPNLVCAAFQSDAECGARMRLGGRRRIARGGC